MAGQKNDAAAGEEKEERVVKHTVKDSVFTSLFKEKRYLIQLYRALHPEDTETTEDDLKDVTVSNVLVDDIYNDLGFTVGTTIMLLIEVQSTWTVNIIFRALMYLVQTYREYFRKTKQNLYKSKKLKMPKPEIYVIYVGDRNTRPEEISLSEEFFEGKDICIDVRVKMIYDGKSGDIINQYVVFTKVCNEQVAKHGRTREAVQEAIRICKERNVLKEYLSSREKEVVDMLMELYDEQEVLRSYVESEKYEAENATKIATARRLLKMGKLSIAEIAEGSGLTVEEVERLSDIQLV
ncbi:hypothetical protein C804_03343 [Lachnospiraceae bacterium A4]|nr:hypothetical protein C804_03343 [Lachnospiraceae bacterium A4]